MLKEKERERETKNKQTRWAQEKLNLTSVQKEAETFHLGSTMHTAV